METPPPWFRNRRYLHFDSPIGYKKAVEICSSPNRVAKHSFFPLISYFVTSTKVYENDAGEITPKKKERPIAYAAHVDSHIYSYYADVLGRAYEAALSERNISHCVLAFRSLGKSNIHFASDAFRAIQDFGECSAIALDITGFFDNLDHRYLKEAWKQLLDTASLPSDHYALYKSLTKYSSVSKKALYDALGVSLHNPRSASINRLCEPDVFRQKVRKAGLISTNSLQKGIPQGTPISALLSNVYMLDFDVVAERLARKIGGMYFRYCDDMLFVVPPSARNELAGRVRGEIKRIKLDINTDKTELRDFYLKAGRQYSDQPLQYLGFTFDGQKILLRSASLARYAERMKRGVRLAKATMRKRNERRLARGEPKKALFKRTLYQRYSYLGKRNFLSYGFRAARVMDSQSIRKQLKPLWRRLRHEIKK